MFIEFAIIRQCVQYWHLYFLLQEIYENKKKNKFKK
jgi:hypothetical protein